MNKNLINANNCNFTSIDDMRGWQIVLGDGNLLEVITVSEEYDRDGGWESVFFVDYEEDENEPRVEIGVYDNLDEAADVVNRLIEKLSKEKGVEVVNRFEFFSKNEEERASEPKSVESPQQNQK